VPGTRYLRILRRPGTARLFLSTLIARIPDSIAATAIVVLVRSVTGSYSAAGVTAGTFGIGTAIAAPLTGRTLDRLGQRRVLPVLAAGFAGALVALALACGHLAADALGALALAAGLFRPPVEAALRAMWPRLVPSAQIDAAYVLDSTGQELIWIGGPLLLGLLLATGRPQLPLMACAVVSVAGTILYSTGLPAPGHRNAASAAPSPLRRRGLRILLIPAACYGVAAGILNLALVAFASAHGGVAWAGVLVAIWGLGSLAGGLLYGSRDWGGPVERRAMGCLALFGAALMLLAAAHGLTVLALLMIPLGMPLSPWLGSLSASVQRAVPAASSTEAFAWTFAVITVAMAAGSAISGVIIQGAGPETAFLAAGGLGLTGAASGALREAFTKGSPGGAQEKGGSDAGGEQIEQGLCGGGGRGSCHRPFVPYSQPNGRWFRSAASVRRSAASAAAACPSRRLYGCQPAPCGTGRPPRSRPRGPRPGRRSRAAARYPGMPPRTR
jgi:predicted MFS family arabinose efflux permease